MKHELDITMASAQCLNGALDSAHFTDLLDWLATDPAVTGHSPDQTCQLDPRDGSLVVYSSSRSGRHHDSPKDQTAVSEVSHSCPICKGRVTRILDLAPLSEGFTFISQNLFPILTPAPRLEEEVLHQAIYPDPEHLGRVAYGMHLLQWTSSVHGHDWHNMPIADLKIVLKRLARLERRLMKGASGYMPAMCQGDDIFGCFSVIKNWGADAGASLSHGHQQIAFSNIMPQRAFNNWAFFRRHERTFSQYMLQENPDNLTVAQWSRWRLVVPYFMQRPLSIMLFHCGAGIRRLYELDDKDIEELSSAIQLAIQLLLDLIPTYNRPAAYNFAVHNGPDSEVYMEFFPVTQTTGGFERLGLWICQEQPERAARQLRKAKERLKA